MAVIDASVVVKIVTLEPGSQEAFQSVSSHDDCCAPDWLVVEVANALTKKTRVANLSVEQINGGLQLVPELVPKLIDVRSLLPDAISLSLELQHALYDCCYLALAIKRGVSLITADKKFVAAANRAGLRASVQQLIW